MLPVTLKAVTEPTDLIVGQSQPSPPLTSEPCIVLIRLYLLPILARFAQKKRCLSDNQKLQVENQKLLALLGRFTLISTKITGGVSFLVIFVFARFLRTGACGFW